MLELRWCAICEHQIIAPAFIQGEKPDGTVNAYHIDCFYEKIAQNCLIRPDLDLT